MDFFKTKNILLILAVVVLTLVSFGTRFWRLDFPSEVVFDEFHFFHFVEEYEKGNYFFDIHPPLGKLLFWQVARMANIGDYIQEKNDDDSWKIGAPYGQELKIAEVRAVSAFFGSLLVLLIFGTVYMITDNIGSSFFGACLVLFDSALLVESQYILMDSMLIFFTTLGLSLLLFHQKNIKKRKSTKLIWLGVSLVSAIAVSIKWTGVSVLGLAGIVLLWNLIKNKNLGEFFGKMGTLFSIVVIVYLSFFWMHFNILTHSGTGDAFHTPEFQSSLIGSEYFGKYEQKSFWEKFIELNRLMGERSASISAEHAYASRWNDWIVGNKPIYYWNKDIFSESYPAKLEYQQKIYLFGNSIIWLGSFFFFIMASGYFIWQFFSKKYSDKLWTLGFLILAYLANWLPFVFISRASFLYHYLNALVVSFLIFAFMLNLLPKQIRKYFGISFLLLAIIVFVSLLPIVYGWTIEISWLERHNFWLWGF